MAENGGIYDMDKGVLYRNRTNVRPFIYRPISFLAESKPLSSTPRVFTPDSSLLLPFFHLARKSSATIKLFTDAESSQMNDQLMKYMDSLVPASEDPVKNQTILSLLNQVADFFIHSVVPDPAWKCGDVFVRAFGSFGLGLVSMRSDVDVVLIAPNFVTREMFFGRFVDLLKEQMNVKDVCPVESTFVPVIKFTYNDTEVDLTFVRLADMMVPDDAILLSDAVLANMDEKSKKSLNGWRVCQYLLHYVPDIKTFRIALTFIKHWAVRRLIYSNLLGYLGGVSWAILVAHVCKEHPKKDVAGILLEVFRTLVDWDWTRPININEKANPLAVYQRGTGENYVMPIITPCVPYQISSYNITITTLKTIREEAGRAMSLMFSSIILLDDLLAERNPFEEYELYLVVLVTAPTDSALKRWKGLVESRLRQFVGLLEGVGGMKRCQIIPKGFSAPEEDYGWLWCIGFEHPGGINAVHKAVGDFQMRVLNPLVAKEGVSNNELTQRVFFKAFKRDKLISWLDM